MSSEQVKELAGGPEVLALLDRQVTLYGELEAMAGKQRALIAADDTTPLLKLLAQRQKLTRELQILNDRMAPFRADWPRTKEALPAPQRVEAERLLRDVQDRLRRLLEQDERDVRLLSARKQQVGSALAGLRSGKRAVAAYRHDGGAADARFDRMDGES